MVSTKKKTEILYKKRVTMKGDRQVPIWTYRERDIIGVAEFLTENMFTLSDVVKVEGIKVVYNNNVQPPKKSEMVEDLTDKFWDYVNDKTGEKELPTLSMVGEEVVVK